MKRNGGELSVKQQFCFKDWWCLSDGWIPPNLPAKGVLNHSCNLLLKFESESYPLHLGVNVGRSSLICSKSIHDKIC